MCLKIYLGVKNLHVPFWLPFDFHPFLKKKTNKNQKQNKTKKKHRKKNRENHRKYLQFVRAWPCKRFEQTGIVGREGAGATLLGIGEFLKAASLRAKAILEKREGRDG